MFSPWGQSGLEAKILASALNIWPRPGRDLVALICNRTFFPAKIVLNLGITLIFPAIILSRMLYKHYLVLFHNYFWPRPWPQPPEIGLGLGLGL